MKNLIINYTEVELRHFSKHPLMSVILAAIFIIIAILRILKIYKEDNYEYRSSSFLGFKLNFSKSHPALSILLNAIFFVAFAAILCGVFYIMTVIFVKVISSH